MFDRAKLGDDRSLAGRRDDGGLRDLQPARIRTVEPSSNEILVRGEFGHPRLVGGLLVNGLSIEADDRESLGRCWVSRMIDCAASA